MRLHRLHCFYPGWPVAYAYASAWGSRQKADREDESRYSEPWYAHRRHGSRGGRSGFGVRRPLRFLSYQLDLDDSQRREVAIALDSVKTERAQAALDEKKLAARLADQVRAPDVSAESLRAVLSGRVESAERVERATAEALKRIVAILDPDQREELAYLIRTGAFRL